MDDGEDALLRAVPNADFDYDDEPSGEGNPLLARRKMVGAASAWFDQEQFAGIQSESDEEPVCDTCLYASLYVIGILFFLIVGLPSLLHQIFMLFYSWKPFFSLFSHQSSPRSVRHEHWPCTMKTTEKP